MGVNRVCLVLALCVGSLLGCADDHRVAAEVPASEPLAAPIRAPTAPVTTIKVAKATSSEPAKPTPLKREEPKSPKAPEPGQIGYVGTLTGGPKIPVCVNSDDVASITRQDKAAMMDLLYADTLFSADGGANVRIVARKFPGLVKVAVLDGESAGREGWVPHEMVQ